MILPLRYAASILESGEKRGTLDIKFSETELLALVDGFHLGFGGGGRTRMAEVTHSWHALADLPAQRGMGLWYRVRPELHGTWKAARARSGAISLGDLRDQTFGGWKTPRRDGAILALTWTDLEEWDHDLEIPTWAGWLLYGDSDQAEPCFVVLADDEMPPLLGLGESWPVRELAEKRVLLIGTGSIGSAAAEALVSAGIRHLTLVDPDRLLFHNFARHRVRPPNVGRFKVDAMREQLLERDPSLDVDALRLDVIYDADQLRPLLAGIDIAVVTVDGVEPRRVANHLIRKARKPAVFACVLEDGAFGEVIRFDPTRTGCLLCARAALREEKKIEPEPTLDRGYGTGSRHLPMTAVPTDLSLVADLAAKVTLATLLEPLGIRDQRLEGDHAILGLRPKPDRKEPFNIEKSGGIRWHPVPPPRDDCPSCS
jgi:hypothetical protein